MTQTRFLGVTEILIDDGDAPNDLSSDPVPAGQAYRLVALRATFVTSGDAGDRRLAIKINNANDYLIYFFDGGAVQADGATIDYFFAVGNPNDSAVVSGDGSFKAMRRALADALWLPEGYQVEVLDIKNIDAGDDLITACRMVVEVYGE